MVNIKDEEGSDLSIHPLHIDHVVEKILSFACTNSGENLLSYRLVCKLWHGIATTLFKPNLNLEVGSYCTSVPRFRRLLRLHRSRPRGSNSSYSRWPSPFVKFRLCQELFQPMYASVLNDFFQTFQDSIEVLDIWLDLRSTLAELSLNSKSRLCFFPNLKTLVYDDRRVILEGQEDGRGRLLQCLVELAPNLHSLSLRFQRDFRGSVECLSEAVFENISHVFKNPKLQKSLKCLKLDVHVNDQLLDCLKTAGIQLEDLEMAVRASAFTFPEFRQLLEWLQRSLKSLKLSFIERDSRCLISFPRMAALQLLEIQGTDGFSKHSVGFCDFTYKDQLPSLKSLKINIWAAAPLKWAQFLQSRSPIMTLTEFKLPGELCDKRGISCVSSTFPNLRKLHVSVYSLTLSSLGVIFERMTKLEELTISKFPSLWDRNEKNIDDILTGLSEFQCGRMWSENANLAEVSDEDLLLIKTSPGLTDLKHLKKLSMPDLQYQASYTDITGYLALAKMPNLKYLNAGRSYLSTSCLALLSEKFPEMEAQRRLSPVHYKEPEDDDDDGSFLELPGDTCVYL